MRGSDSDINTFQCIIYITLCTQALNGDINERTLASQNAPKIPDVIVEAYYNEDDEVISKMKSASLHDKGN